MKSTFLLCYCFKSHTRWLWNPANDGHCHCDLDHDHQHGDFCPAFFSLLVSLPHEPWVSKYALYYSRLLHPLFFTLKIHCPARCHSCSRLKIKIISFGSASLTQLRLVTFDDLNLNSFPVYTAKFLAIYTEWVSLTSITDPERSEEQGNSYVKVRMTTVEWRTWMAQRLLLISVGTW